jgi:hypothetical protein
MPRPADIEQVLSLPLPANDAAASTVREYLIELLAAVWREDEGFSGKRPFGNSGWKYDLYGPLIKAGFIDGRIDDKYDSIEEVDEAAAYRLIADAIQALGRTQQ